ncbi:hypothetical protein BMR07_14330 [Methylococcaceae bacterium CS1]|nr:hypothetical protein BMR11_15975 [Methylococcaceae bacterium CS5]TXK95854.1 hypothetical protein BMR10_09155 [Methylococcaceae bacterium CS4]TXL03782.1 hypothetical protein BMR07_14330 [Methylococcaceae bacterium CS1]TXL05264.1 hypothetical protein BMR09_10560 [Methylococcaceae bacterium CS3]TXL08384.1 hypothetical protein BMR08_14110 [Methylococcaceae bacterium CS2]
MNKFNVLVLLMCGLQAMSASADEGENLDPMFFLDNTTVVLEEPEDSDFCAEQRSPYGLNEEELAEHLSSLQEGPCAVNYKPGDIGLGGGRVFYTTDDGLHGMEAAPNDISGLEWGCHGSKIEDASGVGIGDGEVNSEDLADHACASVSRWGGSTISDAVQDYEVNGFKDWYIPSRDDMKHMHTVLTSKGVGNFAQNLYWVSTVSTHTNNRFAWMVSGGRGRYWYGERSLRKPVRPIRSF